MSEAYWYSKLAVANDCLAKYKLQFIDGEQVPKEASGDLEFGSALHVGLSAMLDGRDARAAFNLYWSTLPAGVTWGRYDHETLQKKGELFLERFQRLHLKNFKSEHRAERLQSSYQGTVFEGTPDFIGQYKGVPVIADFKTSAYPYAKERILTTEQLYLYAYLAEGALSYKAKELAYVVFCKGEERIQIQKITLTKERMSDIMSNMLAQVSLITGAKQFPRNHSACVKGPYVCPFFKPCHGG